MNFSSNIFIFYFFPISIIAYFLTNKFLPKIRDYILIVLSLIFYGWTNWEFAGIIVIYVLIVFVLGKLIDKYKKKALYLIPTSIIIIILGFYKYIDFFINNINRFLKMAIKPINPIVPLGISFIVFETISYFVDVYKSEKSLSGSFVEVSSFILFFPKIISGPIVLWRDYHDTFNNRTYEFDKTVSGLERVIIGLSKKVLIADILAKPVATVFSQYLTNNIDIQSCWLAILAYAIQIYFDFSGYSDIAIGLSNMMGFDFKENFDFPYRSTSITEFWRRWHISLGTFFREYVYIPLGGNRKHVYINLFIVFLLTGIWHGSSWTLILWGILHGIMIVLERMIMKKEWYIKIPKFIKWLYTFIFVSFSWILFNTSALGEATKFLKYLFGFEEYGNLVFGYQYIFNFRVTFMMIVGLIGSLLGDELIDKLNNKINSSKLLTIIKYILLVLLFYVVIVYVTNSTYSPFVYFGF